MRLLEQPNDGPGPDFGVSSTQPGDWGKYDLSQMSTAATCCQHGIHGHNVSALVSHYTSCSPATQNMPQSRPADPVQDGGLATDIVIPVMGLTKAGKSSFLNELLGRQVCEVGNRLPSCTDKVSSHIVLEVPSPDVRKLLNGRRVVLVDTPGFDHTYAGDDQVLDKITAWLAKSYRQGMHIAAVLYLHDISNDDSESVVDRSIALFSRLCGVDAMDQVAFVTTKWDRHIGVQEGKNKVKELESKSWRDTLDQGASIFHAQPSSKKDLLSPEHKKPWDIVYQILLSSKPGAGRILKIQDDMVKKELRLKETDAGKELKRRKASPGVGIKRILQRLKDLMFGGE